MKIKKFEAETEVAAIELAKAELGADAIVLSIKTVKPGGIRKFFKKPVVEITAAFDERRVEPKVRLTPPSAASSAAAAPPATAALAPVVKEAPETEPAATKEEFFGGELSALMKEITISEQEVKIKDLVGQLESKEESLAKLSRLVATASRGGLGATKYKTPVVRMFDDTLRENGVMDEIRSYILDEIDLLTDIGEIDINLIVKIIYRTIVSLMGDSEPPLPESLLNSARDAAVYAFVGGTGVGKTTTIAKIAANYMLERGLNVGLVTADTYRMAAVEQLKLYGEIFGVEVGVVYNAAELPERIAAFNSSADVILVDTAGRSPRSEEALKDVKELLAVMPREKEVFLVLSLTTKSEDLLSIVEQYERIIGGEFRLIFTKWDETTTVGSVLNVVYKTGRKIAYITTGQNVPQDFEVLRPEKAARAILGL